MKTKAQLSTQTITSELLKYKRKKQKKNKKIMQKY